MVSTGISCLAYQHVKKQEGNNSIDDKFKVSKLDRDDIPLILAYHHIRRKEWAHEERNSQNSKKRTCRNSRESKTSAATKEVLSNIDLSDALIKFKESFKKLNHSRVKGAGSCSKELEQGLYDIVLLKKMETLKELANGSFQDPKIQEDFDGICRADRKSGRGSKFSGCEYDFSMTSSITEITGCNNDKDASGDNLLENGKEDNAALKLVVLSVIDFFDRLV